MTVRPATIFDVDLVAPLFDAYRQFYRRPADLELARRFLLERFQHHESVVFLALTDTGEPAGFTQLYPSFSSAAAARIYVLNDLYVDPSARRQRVGAMLLRAAAEYARAAGAVRLTLSTEMTNVGAQRLYESAGWARQTEFCTYTLPL
jgi:ribosomal protein S18 acetylase RimI-like enzyme